MTTRTVFFSHAHADNDLCTPYVEALRQQGVDVWYDLTNIQNGRLLTQEIQQQLQQRSVLIVLVTSRCAPVILGWAGNARLSRLYGTGSLPNRATDQACSV